MDNLMQRYYELCNITEYDPVTYAGQWWALANAFDAEGRTAMAAECFARANKYRVRNENKTCKSLQLV